MDPEQRTHNPHEGITQGRARNRTKAKIASTYAGSVTILLGNTAHPGEAKRKLN
jgi:hypothetical protein